ncbi:MAG: hypothetical protein ACEQSR_01295 [Candidatus Methylacidiphilales bacterium]
MTIKAILGTSKAISFPISRNNTPVIPADLSQLKIDFYVQGVLKLTYKLNEPESGFAIVHDNEKFNVYLEASKTDNLPIGLFEYKIWIKWPDARFEDDFVLAKKGVLLEWTK